MKEDDMDEMMRKAAENYDVDAEKASDWNAVFAAVHGEGNEPPVEEKKRKRRFVFWWFLLIPLGWIANTEYNKFNTQHSITKNNSASSLQTKTKDAEANTLPVAGNNLSTKNLKLTVTGQEKKGITTSVENNSSIHYKNQLKAQNKIEEKSSNNNLNIDNSSLPEKYENNEPQIQSADKTKDINNVELNNNGNNIIDSQTLIYIQKDNSTAINKNTKPADISKAKSALKKEKNNTHYFYAGLLAGGDFSFVHFQKTQSVGYNIGLLVGYKFNKISIESGLFLDKKNYYTSGEYFDKSKVPYFYNAELLSANGYCKMFEIPLNVKYDISKIKKHTWFATTGLSSYLMNKEFYNYAYIKNGQEYNGGYPYYHTTQNWFSVLNLSAGYQLQIHTKNNLRIEPYYKTTFSGVGTGSLSISSAGINIGITRRIP
ncbi:MAG: hypothetical protein ABI405_12910 [Parafilimonas sp.]